MDPDPPPYFHFNIFGAPQIAYRSLTTIKAPPAVDSLIQLC